MVRLDTVEFDRALPMNADVLRAFSVLILCQLCGEFVARLAHVPVPGPVIGILLLLCLLAWRREIPDSLQKASGGLLNHLSLLFVPAGTGVMLHGHRLRSEWWPIVAALVGGTVLTLIVTVLVFVAVRRLLGDAPATRVD